MRKFLVMLAVMLAAVAVTAPTSVAGTGGGSDGVCPTQGGDEGVTVTDNGDGTVTVEVDEGFTLTYLCLKAGSEEQGCGFEEFEPDLEGPASADFDIPCAKELSHFGAVTEVTETGTTSTSTSTTGGGDTSTSTATTGGGDTSTSTATTGGGDTGTTTGSTAAAAAAATTTGGGGGAGGAGGGGGGGGGGGSGELPFTGLPVLIPLLLGGALLGSGIVLLRRGRQED